MDLATQLAHLRADSDALLAACLADPTAPVPSCPGWDRTALLSHVGRIHRWAGGQLVCGPGERIRINEVSAPEGADLTAEYATGADRLIALLTTMDLAATWPTWAGPQPGTFFPRRMTQELVIHRRDADPAPIDPALGVDGVDEMLELFAPRIPADRFDGRRGSLHLHATDADGEWLIQVAPDGITF
ncbi:MAG: maleylpyruvate isomerase family mycothiol-dependent enzyme, partial [Acidimicrobiales bacterium]